MASDPFVSFDAAFKGTLGVLIFMSVLLFGCFFRAFSGLAESPAKD